MDLSWNFHTWTNREADSLDPAGSHVQTGARGIGLVLHLLNCNQVVRTWNHVGNFERAVLTYGRKKLDPIKATTASAASTTSTATGLRRSRRHV